MVLVWVGEVALGLSIVGHKADTVALHLSDLKTSTARQPSKIDILPTIWLVMST